MKVRTLFLHCEKVLPLHLELWGKALKSLQKYIKMTKTLEVELSEILK